MDDTPLIAQANSTHICEISREVGDVTKYDEKSRRLKEKDCPEKVAMTLISRRQWELPVFGWIIQAPTLRKDGSIVWTARL